MKRKLVTLLTLSLFSAINCAEKKTITKLKQPWYVKVAKTSSEILKETFTYKSFWSDIFTVPIITPIYETLSTITDDSYHIKNDWKDRNFSENLKNNLKLFSRLEAKSFLVRTGLALMACSSDPMKELEEKETDRKSWKEYLKMNQANINKINRKIYQDLNKKTEEVKQYLQKQKFRHERNIINIKRKIAKYNKEIEEFPEITKTVKHFAYASFIRPIIFKAIFHLVLAKISQYKITTEQDHELCTNEFYSRLWITYMNYKASVGESDRINFFHHIIILMKKNITNEECLKCLASNAFALYSNKNDVIFMLSQLDKLKHKKARLAILERETLFDCDTVIKDYLEELDEYSINGVKDIESIKKYLKSIKNKIIDMKIIHKQSNQDNLYFTIVATLKSKTTLKMNVDLDINKIDAKYKIFNNNSLDTEKTAEKIIKEIEPTYGLTKDERFINDFVGRVNELKTVEDNNAIYSPTGLVHILKNQEPDYHKNLMNHLKTIPTLKEQCDYILEWAMDKSLKSENTTVFHHVFSHKDFHKLEEKTKYSLIEKMIENNLENCSDKKTRWFIFDNNETPLDILRKNNTELYNYALELSEMQEID